MRLPAITLPLAAALAVLLPGTIAPAQPLLWFAVSDGGWKVMGLSLQGVQTLYAPSGGEEIADIAVDGQGRLFASLVTGLQETLLVRVDPGGATTSLLPTGEIIGRIHGNAAGEIYYVRAFGGIGRVDPPAILYSGNVLIADLASDAFGTLHAALPMVYGVGGPNHVARLSVLGTPALVPDYAPPPGWTVAGVRISPCGALLIAETSPAADRIVRSFAGIAAPVYTTAPGERISGGIAVHPSGLLAVPLAPDPPNPSLPSRLALLHAGSAATLYETAPGGRIVAAAIPPATCPAPTFATGSAGAATGPPVDILAVNGSAGGPLRRVRLAMHQPFAVAVAALPGAPAPAGFSVFGRIDSPSAAGILPGPPGLGDFAFRPCPLDPFDPALFTLADSLGLAACPPYLAASGAPWTIAFPAGIPLPFTWTLQGLVADPLAAPYGFSATNAIVIEIQP